MDKLSPSCVAVVLLWSRWKHHRTPLFEHAMPLYSMCSKRPVTFACYPCIKTLVLDLLASLRHYFHHTASWTHRRTLVVDQWSSLRHPHLSPCVLHVDLVPSAGSVAGVFAALSALVQRYPKRKVLPGHNVFFRAKAVESSLKGSKKRGEDGDGQGQIFSPP